MTRTIGTGGVQRLIEQAKAGTGQFGFRLAVLWIVYIAAMKATLAIPFAREGVAPVWMPTGVALFFLIRWSPKLWPAVLAAFLAVHPTASPTELIEGTAHALQPAFAAWLYLRLAKTGRQIDRARELGMALTIGGIVMPCFFGLVMEELGRHWSLHLPQAGDWKTWLAASFNGVVLITPLLSAVAGWKFERAGTRAARVAETVAACGLLIIVTGLVFDVFEARWPGMDLGIERMADALWICPFLAWIALRTCPPLTSLALLLTSGIALWQTCEGAGPFAGDADAANAMWLYGFIAVVATFAVLVSWSKFESDRHEDQWRQSQSQYQLLFKNNPHPMWVYDVDTLRFVEVNDSAVQKYGYSREEFLAMTIKEIRPKEDVQRLIENVKSFDPEQRNFGVWRHVTKRGVTLDVEITGCGVEAEGHRRRLILANDITERRRLEMELRHAHKLEAVGRLAGGVAHDFNNLIMIVSSYAERMLYRPVEEKNVRQDAEKILQVTERAAGLTQQLLAFSRKQVLMPKVIELNQVLNSTRMLVEKLAGESVVVRWELANGVCPVKLDSGQLTQVLLNLCANARDAMHGKGTITIATDTVRITEDFPLGATGNLPAGIYAVLQVGDQGEGMTPEVQERIFEPFFTTKGQGRGTGLGLATVYGIVRQSGGFVGVRSRVGRGSEFSLYFPKVDGSSMPETPAVEKPVERGKESVLVVEDESELRGAVVESLRMLGYQVTHANDGKHALEIAEGLTSVDVMVTDVVMPNMRGTEAARVLRRKFPGMKVIFMSGYADGAVKAEELDANTIFLAKPLSLSTLANNIRALLARENAKQAG